MFLKKIGFMASFAFLANLVIAPVVFAADERDLPNLDAQNGSIELVIKRFETNTNNILEVLTSFQSIDGFSPWYTKNAVIVCIGTVTAGLAPIIVEPARERVQHLVKHLFDWVSSCDRLDPSTQTQCNISLGITIATMCPLGYCLYRYGNPWISNQAAELYKKSMMAVIRKELAKRDKIYNSKIKELVKIHIQINDLLEKRSEELRALDTSKRKSFFTMASMNGNLAMMRSVLRSDNPQELQVLETLTRMETHSCSICLNELFMSESINDQTVIRGCGHMFHSRCLMAWYLRKHTCPICRDEASPKVTYIAEQWPSLEQADQGS